MKPVVLLGAGLLVLFSGDVRAADAPLEISFQLRARDGEALWLRGESGRTLSLRPHDVAHVRWDATRSSWLVQVNGKLPNFVQQRLEVASGDHRQPSAWHELTPRAMTRQDHATHARALERVGIGISALSVSGAPTRSARRTRTRRRRRSPTERAARDLRQLENFVSGGLSTHRAMRALGRLTRGKVGILQQLRDKLGTRAADMYSGNLINFATYKKLSTSIAHNEHIARRGKLRGYITSTHHVNGERLLGVQLAPKSKAGPFQRTSHVLGQTRHNGATYRLYKVGRRRAR